MFSQFIHCPNCRSKHSIERRYKDVGDDIEVRVYKCTACKYQAGIKEFENIINQ